MGSVGLSAVARSTLDPNACAGDRSICGRALDADHDVASPGELTAKDLRVTITPLQMGLARIYDPTLPIGGVLTDIGDDGDLGSLHGPAEEAVLDLLREDEESPALEKVA